jgi:CRISPR-associated endonuclease/helicase Cas3
MYDYDVILAKSEKYGVKCTLAAHTEDVIGAAEELFGKSEKPSRLGQCWLRFFKLSSDSWEPFHNNLRAACALHDWGKANDTFQAAVRGVGDQAIRHEHFSALLIGLPEVAAWLKSGNLRLDVPIVLSAVLTHHLKASGRADGFAAGASGTNFRLVDYGNGLADIVRTCEDVLGLKHLDAATLPALWVYGKPPNDVRAHRQRIQDTVLEPLKRALRSDHARNRLLLAVRAALLAADAAGSGLVREGKSVLDWIRENVSCRQVLTKEKVQAEVIKHRVDEMKAAGKWHDLGDGKDGWSDFQLACDHLPDRALLLAPCGSGKTLAAWRWIAARLDKRPSGHAIFLYPTRATAREGFKDYVSWAPEADAALMHGTSGFDLSDMFANTPDPRKARDYEVERRLFSLGYWPRRIFSATVDQFLAFMQYGYGPICMLPVLADSVVVIDEVHSFDNNMFAALKDFLKSFDVPVLCMTATLPISRRDDLIACGLTPPAEWPPDLQIVAAKSRYRLRRLPNRAAATAHVREALKGGRRVLWVVNQVKRAHAIAKEFAVEFNPSSNGTEMRTAEGATLICYHSRFRLSDRVKRHADTMRALKELPGPAIGVTTQVCEMSLDIDIDLLVTEECPVTSTVQRMGRCNRERNPRALDQSGDVLVYPPDEPAPYSPNDLTGVPEFLSAVADCKLSQDDLEAALLKVPSPEPEGDPLSRFLTSGPYAVSPKEDDGEGFREGDDFNRPCVLTDDVADFNGAAPAKRPGFVLPVPRRLARRRDDEANGEHRKLPAYLGVADSAYYHPAIGFCDIPTAEWRRGGR